MTPRPVHPLAWWAWGALVGAAAIRITNPILSVLLIASVGLVVAARRREVPWAGTFGRFVKLGIAVMVVRLVLQVVFAPRVPGHVVFTFPEADLPTWAAGVSLGGAVTAEALLQALYESLRLVGLLAAVGAASSLADPHRLLRVLPDSLHEAGVAVTVALSLAPQAGVAAAQVRDARRLRGRPTRGIAAIRGVALPVLEGALERSIALAASMDARGFGRREMLDPRRRRTARVMAGAGLVAVAVGMYGVLDAAAPAGLGAPALVAGGALLAVAIGLGSGATRRTHYRPDPWTTPEWVTSGSALALLAGLVVAGRAGVDLSGSVSPLAFPDVPLVPALLVVLAAVPALPRVLGPEPAS